MNLKKKAQVIMLPTHEKSNIFDVFGKLEFIYGESTGTYESKNKHLYIVDDSEIKERDWCEDNGTIYQIKDKNHLFAVLNLGSPKKVIATTNTDLHIIVATDGNNNPVSSAPLPQPSPSFIKAYIDNFNRGNVITDVLVEYEDYWIPITFSLDVAWRPKVDSKNYITITKTKDNFNLQELEDALVKHYLDIGSKKGCNLGEDVRKWTKEWINSNL
jgi:hypothetical protein